MPNKDKPKTFQEPLALTQKKLKAFALLYEKMHNDSDDEDCIAVLQARQHFIDALCTCINEPHKIENTLREYHSSLEYIGVRIATEEADTLQYFDAKDTAALYFMLGFAIANIAAVIAIAAIGLISASPFIAVFALGFLCGLSYNILCTSPKMRTIRQEERDLFRMFQAPKASKEPLSSQVIKTIQETLAEPFQPT